jgi:ATP-dependent DNA ligase
MLARLERALPDGDYLFEPKWDGFRCLAFRDGATVDLRSRNQRPFARYFPEVVAALQQLDESRFVLDGELVTDDFPSLLARTHPAVSRVERLARETPARLIAFDLVAIGDDDLTTAPFTERRARLERLLAAAPPTILVTPTTDDPAVAAAWLDGAAAIDGGAGAARRARRPVLGDSPATPAASGTTVTPARPSTGEERPR